MKHSFATTAAFVGLLSVSAPAMANNAQVEEALRSRPDLSTFYQGLVSTGVINELKEGQPYTVFAPTNDAFTKLSADKYPCFYSEQCKAEVAAIMRNHIVPGEKHLEDINPRGGSAYSMFTIGNKHLVGSEPTKNHYMVDGRNVLSENQLMGGMLYRVDDVLATNQDLAQFEAPIVVMANAPAPLPPRVPEGEVVTITTTHPIPY